MYSLIGDMLLAALILSFIWWLSALSKDRRRRMDELDARNDRIDEHYQRNLARARRLGIRD